MVKNMVLNEIIIEKYLVVKEKVCIFAPSNKKFGYPGDIPAKG